MGDTTLPCRTEPDKNDSVLHGICVEIEKLKCPDSHGNIVVSEMSSSPTVHHLFQYINSLVVQHVSCVIWGISPSI